MLPRAEPSSLPGAVDLRGLSAAEVAERVAEGRSNREARPPTRTLGQILARNTFTWLNLLLGLLGGITLSTGSVPDATFLTIAVINTVVGAVQELRAKRTLDALSVINAPLAHVVREGEQVEVDVAELVVDDLLRLRPGDQVVVDAAVVGGAAELDESLATGESDPVPRAAGDQLLSGSWVVSGTLLARVTEVGADTYAGRLAAEARQFSLGGSELMDGINRILRWLLVVMVVVGPPLLWRQLQIDPWRSAVRATVAGLVGMVPEGLVLLTTLAFLRAAVVLGRRRVLVQELPAVEGLARVDALCTDKTGTLTEGRVEWAALIPAAAGAEAELRDGLAALAGLGDANATLAAVREGIGPSPAWAPGVQVPFNSSRKWSGATFDGHGTWVLGAPEMVAGTDPDGLRSRMEELAEAGSRVLVVARGVQGLTGPDLPGDLTLLGAVQLRERLRPDAAATLAYFARQEVTVRVVSGDNPATVAAVAAAVGLSGSDAAVDARALPAEPAALADAVEVNRVFGRVTPEQKRAMVGALRSRGHVVAMTGDGVNDTLALKDADLGIAMGSGSAVARGVAQLVLLDDQFEALPPVVAEGRRVLTNIERAASLFLVKNVYSVLLSVAVAAAGWTYPFLPRHLTLVSGLAIGIPGFFLALAPNEARFAQGFILRVLRFSVPAGLITGVAVLGAYGAARAQNATVPEARTIAVAVVAVLSLLVVVLAARPLQPWKLGMVVTLGAAFVGAFFLPGINAFFDVARRPSVAVGLEGAAITVAAGVAVVAAATWRHGGGGIGSSARSGSAAGS